MRKDAPGLATGVSLVELSIVLAVLAILAGLALPGFQDLLQRQRTAAALHLLSGQLAQARNTAITRRMPVTVCPSLGDGRCRAEPDWSAGWLVYHDPARTSQPRSADHVLRDTRQPLHHSIRIQGSVGRPRVRYQPDGRSGGSNLTLRVCSRQVQHAELVVNNAGRVRTRRLDSIPCPN